MKYKTFRALLIVGGVLILGGLVSFVLVRAVQQERALGAQSAAPVLAPNEGDASRSGLASEAPTEAPRLGGAQELEAQPPAAGEAPDGLRDLDVLMLALIEQPVQAKIKDASRGRPFKINLYSDDDTRFNRAKVDLDRDDQWDEKWTFKPGGVIEREVAPNDDENYAERFVLEAKRRWQPITSP